MKYYKKRIQHAFNIKAISYDEYSIVQREVGRRIIERLDLLKFKPLNILDLGSGTGYLAELLSSKFPSSSITCLDLAENMLLECREKNSTFNLVVSDIESLPFKPSSFDLIVSSFTLHWCEEVEKIFYDVRKSLCSDGIFMFTTVGPNTLQELQKAYKHIDLEQHINSFTDMHLYGDSLLKCGFDDPVMDSEEITIEYPTFKEVLNSLKKTGANTVIGQEPKYLSKKSYMSLSQAYPKNKDNGHFPVTYEMIYGMSWNRSKTDIDHSQNRVIPIKKI
ncbi:MAG: malonyl-ACP O-methyltransferase BioC [Gammaproteobacteria bacterium]|jgi:malonyl-CoA O-methyltransferase|nr:malonyl-ACP O-methyltransferase BioC [Gammaproteobacteria bacterium]MBT5406362.1 malonyl-ACP O-methyltransferase BioC [Gammaproteobacteria bacterium]MBT5644392.1 malonyl-ACP O-methyltransferase BioC [Gammaproteobacteria bacterium]MBT5862931.1 malonyl-ACP O-methyltransferase BioC [Gammaproteobacteria bacterium]MBT6734034.1 malonyl-ACP O-methyltransferase BioC [Gammaproteobacteria bacterium]|tara:strand:- start:622 stop:1452 length:831 start_codon:yes stop_codon:yes gene_type:complete